LTLARHRFTPIFSSSGGTRYTSRQVKKEVDGMTELDADRDWVVDGEGKVEWLTRAGGRLAVDFTTDFLHFLSGSPRSSRLAASLTQPLLKGAGYRVTMEGLTQAERSLLYALREFTVYRKDFSVGVASDYYDVLRNRDSAQNSWRSFQTFKQNVARSRALAEEGRLAQSDLDRLQQAELTTETGWINAKRSYRQSLDRFKITLGLPTDIRLVLDDRELSKLTIQHPSLTADEAMQVALSNRLDLYTEREKLEDAGRKLEVAENAFLPGLDLVGGASVTGVERRGFSEPDWKVMEWNVGLDLDLPLDQKDERNSYRSALIDLGRAGRELELAVDNIKLQVSDDWRGLDQAKRNYENAVLGVNLNQRRVEEQELRAELGLGKALDLVDAQNALLSSQNELTDALVAHTIARLRFWRDMGILMIEQDGKWQELTDAKSN
jgi:outer membrane protein TolC